MVLCYHHIIAEFGDLWANLNSRGMKKYVCTKEEGNKLCIERGCDETAVVIPCEVENGVYRIWPERLAVLGVSEDAIPDKATNGTPIIIG